MSRWLVTFCHRAVHRTQDYDGNSPPDPSSTNYFSPPRKNTQLTPECLICSNNILLTDPQKCKWLVSWFILQFLRVPSECHISLTINNSAHTPLIPNIRDGAFPNLNL